MIAKEKLLQYIEKGLSIKEIAQCEKKSQTTIRYWLEKNGLKTKWRGYVDTSDEELLSAATESRSLRQCMINLGKKTSGGAFYHYKKRLKKLGFDFSKWKNGGEVSAEIKNRRSLKREVRLPRTVLKKALDLHGIPYSCSNCRRSTWMKKKIKLHIHHKDHNKTNNDVANLEYLCPNCHSIEHYEEN